METSNLIVVDVETTGTDAKQNSIVSIGAVSISDPSKTFYGECVVWPGAKIEEGALRVNGFKREDIEISALQKTPKKKLEAELIMEFIAWLPKSPMMIAHNAAFDRDFVAEAAKRAGTFSPFSFRTIDVHSVMYMHLLRLGVHVPAKLSLNECLKSLGLPPEPNPHNALTGAQCGAEVFTKIMKYNGEQQAGIFS